MRFSCIIPAFNEWPRIGEVLETVLACEELDEVIVIDDGSTDDTWGVIDGFSNPKLQKIHQENTGKAWAVLAGIRASRWDYIVMIDSDLLHLKPEHIIELIQPVKEWRVEVSLSIRENSLPFYKWIGSDFVSGERVLPRGIFDDIWYYSEGPGFGLEVKMNRKIMEARYRVKNIVLPGVITPRKSIKVGFLNWIIADWKMTFDILSVIPFHQLIRQMWYFSRFSGR